MSELIEHELDINGDTEHGPVYGTVHIYSESDAPEAPMYDEMPDELEINGFTYFKEPPKQG